jgi:hypothetical protein
VGPKSQREDSSELPSTLLLRLLPSRPAVQQLSWVALI